nr:MAG TPA: hypothetical protein [Caudoviricetes sp.]
MFQPSNTCSLSLVTFTYNFIFHFPFLIERLIHIC